ncbi:MAG TPA: hypothetical protein VMW24_14400 [Sedimentisphaerales bacterium]|jgi:hypothetical protein|nr:hypothetical protein [Sedimentisphaerales bacterium]
MSRCYCRAVLAVLVIVFAWVNVSWAPIALTVLGVLLAVLTLGGVCCCAARREQKATEAGASS